MGTNTLSPWYWWRLSRTSRRARRRPHLSALYEDEKQESGAAIMPWTTPRASLTAAPAHRTPQVRPCSCRSRSGRWHAAQRTSSLLSCPPAAAGATPAGVSRPLAEPMRSRPGRPPRCPPSRALVGGPRGGGTPQKACLFLKEMIVRRNDKHTMINDNSSPRRTCQLFCLMSNRTSDQYGSIDSMTENALHFVLEAHASLRFASLRFASLRFASRFSLRLGFATREAETILHIFLIWIES